MAVLVSSSVFLGGCTAIAIVDAAASTAIGAGKLAVKGTVGAGKLAAKGTTKVVGAVIPDGDDEKKKK